LLLDGVVIIEGAVLGVNVGRPIVTNGAFVAKLCGIVSTDRPVVWRGESKLRELAYKHTRTSIQLKRHLVYKKLTQILNFPQSI